MEMGQAGKSRTLEHMVDDRQAEVFYAHDR